MKYFIFSIDDGTIYDRKVIEIFNKYHIKGTFNLNSGLSDFVWYLNGRPIERLDFKNYRSIYDGHEVASHSSTHPHLTMCPGEVIVKEVGEDIDNLERIFNRPVIHLLSHLKIQMKDASISSSTFMISPLFAYLK